ncbi:MAG: hypothetical protein O6933_04645, partial [Planctomycetota bacterium]|nr:hypothetical protein [Planctomycetota bacterium]
GQDPLRALPKRIVKPKDSYPRASFAPVGHCCPRSPSQNPQPPAYDESGQRWLVHHVDLLKAVVLLGEMLGVEWEGG